MPRAGFFSSHHLFADAFPRAGSVGRDLFTNFRHSTFPAAIAGQQHHFHSIIIVIPPHIFWLYRPFNQHSFFLSSRKQTTASRNISTQSLYETNRTQQTHHITNLEGQWDQHLEREFQHHTVLLSTMGKHLYRSLFMIPKEKGTRTEFMTEMGFFPFGVSCFTSLSLLPFEGMALRVCGILSYLTI